MGELLHAQNIAKRKAENKLKELHEAARKKATWFKHWKDEQRAKLLRWNKIKAIQIMLEQKRLHGLQAVQRHLARNHSMHLGEVKQRLHGLEEILSRLKARKRDEARRTARRTHHLRKTIAQRHDHLIRLRKNYRHVMNQVDVYKAKTKNLRQREHVRWVKFQQEFKLLILKAKRLHDERLREGRRNSFLEGEIKKWEHKMSLVEKA